MEKVIHPEIGEIWHDVRFGENFLILGIQPTRVKYIHILKALMMRTDEIHEIAVEDRQIKGGLVRRVA